MRCLDDQIEHPRADAHYAEGSYSRCASAFIVVSVCSWVLYLVIKTAHMPDLTGPSAFLTTGVGIHYGTNKASDILSALKGKPGSNGTNPPQ